MDEREFKERTQKLALRIVRMVGALPKTVEAQVIGKQLLRSGTSIGANYRAACRARSKPDLIAKLALVEEESDETIYWLDLLVGAGIVVEKKLGLLRKETEEVLAMTVASIKTLRFGDRSQIQNPKSKIQNRHE